MRSEIDGVLVTELTRNEDERGWLTELFRYDELTSRFRPAMAYASVTHPGQVRGPHEHRVQSDLICFPGPGEFRVYLWDNREDSASKGASTVIEGGEPRPLMILIPPGVVHAYRNIGDCDGLVINAPNRLYRGEGHRSPVDEIRYEDDPDAPFRVED